MQNSSAMITLAAASRRINRSTETVARWMAAAGDGPQILTFGRRRYVLETAFDRWWSARTRPAMGHSGNGDDSRSAA